VNHVDNSLLLHCADNIANLTKEIGFKEGPLLAELSRRRVTQNDPSETVAASESGPSDDPAGTVT